MSKICPRCGQETVKRNGRVECPMNMPYYGCGWYERPYEITNKKIKPSPDKRKSI